MFEDSTSLEVGDRVYHRREPSLEGKIVHVDPGGDSYLVAWDEDPEAHDFQWRTKLARIEEDDT